MAEETEASGKNKKASRKEKKAGAKKKTKKKKVVKKKVVKKAADEVSGAEKKPAKKKVLKKRSTNKKAPSVVDFLTRLGGKAEPETSAAKGLLGGLKREDLVEAGRDDLASEVDGAPVDTSQVGDAIADLPSDRTRVQVEVSAKKPADGRGKSRTDFKEVVSITSIFSEGTRADPSVNLSAGGIFVETANLLEIGDPVVLTFPLPRGQKMNVTGRVRWVSPFGRVDDPRPGMGIEFVGLNEKKRAHLNALLGLAG